MKNSEPGIGETIMVLRHETAMGELTYGMSTVVDVGQGFLRFESECGQYNHFLSLNSEGHAWYRLEGV